MDVSIVDNAVLLNAVLYSTSDIVICLNKDYFILIFNKSAEQFYQWRSEDVIGKNYLALCDEHGFKSPIDNRFFNHLKTIEYIQDLKNARGKLCTINWLIEPLLQEDNVLEMVMLLGKDVRVKKNTIADNLEKIVNCTPGSLYWKDRNGRYLGCNEFMVKTAGLNSTEDIIGKTDYDLWPENANQIAKNDQHVMSTGKTIFLEEEVRIPEGKLMFFTGVKMPLRDKYDNIIGIIGNSLDITPLKQAEQELRQAKEIAEKADSIKTEFIRNMEHDIRTPFSGIWGLVNYLWQHEEDGEKKEILGDVTNCAKELLDYCNSILDFSKIEQGTLPVLEKKFHLSKLIESIMTIEMPPAKHKKIHLTLDYDDKLPATIVGDQYRLQRILINLVSNAIKFTQKGYINLDVKLVKKVDKNIIIRFVVEDTGIGIPTDKQDFIYEKFSRIISSNKGMYKGVGLGLRIVKQFIEELGGEIDLKSELGKGSTFICTLPFRLPLINDMGEEMRMD